MEVPCDHQRKVKKIQLSSFIKGKQNNLPQSIALMQDPSDVYSYR